MSCVNIENIVYKKTAEDSENFKLYANTKHDRGRMCYIKCGMHMNSLGKNLMCQEIKKWILELFL